MMENQTPSIIYPLSLSRLREFRKRVRLSLKVQNPEILRVSELNDPRRRVVKIQGQEGVSLNKARILILESVQYSLPPL